jgi:hypothetical protein
LILPYQQHCSSTDNPPLGNQRGIFCMVRRRARYVRAKIKLFFALKSCAAAPLNARPRPCFIGKVGVYFHFLPSYFRWQFRYQE